MQKWLRRPVLKLCLIVVIGGILFLLRPKDPISEENFAKIKKGMAEKEVVAMLGPATEEFWLGGSGESDVPQMEKSWIGSGTAIYVQFDKGRVTDKHLQIFDPPSLWERVLKFLGIKQRRVELA
ncbi:MAG TPA: hypothetical protein VKE98_12325 [Gemmataceae bacterium]|nr:hypothetical protein [Gemmataceae bacterium]